MSNGARPGAQRVAQRRPPRPVLRLLVSHLATGGAVLAYHGVHPTEVGNDGGLHVALPRFIETTRAVGAIATYVPLRELVKRHLAGQATRGLVAVTFDDAYASVAALGQLIHDQAMPVTLFVVSGAASKGAPFWWDRIADVFAVASPTRWRSFEDECGLPQAFRAGQPSEMGLLWPLRQWILAEHRGRWPVVLEEPLLQLEAEVGCATGQRPLTFDELDVLLQSPLVDVGVHTVSHAVLPLLSDEEMSREMGIGFAELRARYPGTLPILAAPFGLYDERTVRIAKEQGLTACLTNEATLLDDRAPRELIPRFGMTARHKPWKAVLYTLGCWRGARPRRGAPQRFPALPSAST